MNLRSNDCVDLILVNGDHFPKPGVLTIAIFQTWVCSVLFVLCTFFKFVVCLALCNPTCHSFL